MKLLNLLKFIDKSLVFLILACGLILFLNLRSAEVERWDEFTNIQVVRESSGLNLYFEDDNFFEKPPIWYWLTRILTNVLGEKLWVYRFPSAISGSAIVLIIYQFLKTRTNKTSGFIAALSFLMIPHNILLNPGGYFSSHTHRTADLDSLQILLIFLSFVLIHSNRKYWLISCFILGVGFLVKGPLVLLFLIINTLFYLQGKTERREKYLQLLLGFCIFLIVVLPWHFYMLATYEFDFTKEYFNYHLLERINQGLEGHQKSFWYIFKVFFDIRVNPFWPVLIFVVTMKKMLTTTYVKYSLLIIFAVLLAFSLVETKLAWYILPVYPFLCLVLGSVLYQILFKKHSKEM
jgi:4-amino-4-deoxy-L-arabinose transferase-like glycosyltransferase